MHFAAVQTLRQVGAVFYWCSIYRLQHRTYAKTSAPRPVRPTVAHNEFVQSDGFDNDELFFQELREGHRAAELVADALRKRDLQVVVTPLEVRDRVEDRRDFAYEHDLLVGARRPCRIDVKSRDLKFEGPTGYPYATAFVDTVAGWRQKTHKPVAIVLVSKPTGDMAVIPRSSEEHWRSRPSFDRRRQIEDDFFLVDKRELTAFGALVEWLHARER